MLFCARACCKALLPMPKDTPFEHLFDRPRDAYLLAIIAVSIGPLMEELFFRGFMYPVLARRMGAAWAIVLTALPFGLIHLPQYGWAWGGLLVIILVGVVCGVVRAVTRSVAASFLVHVGYNGTQMTGCRGHPRFPAHGQSRGRSALNHKPCQNHSLGIPSEAKNLCNLAARHPAWSVAAKGATQDDRPGP